MAKLLLIVIGLWVAIGGYLFFVARMNNRPINTPEIVSESFYYAAIAFAVYHLMTRNRNRRKPEPEEAPPEELSEIHAQTLPGDGGGKTS